MSPAAVLNPPAHGSQAAAGYPLPESTGATQITRTTRTSWRQCGERDANGERNATGERDANGERNATGERDANGERNANGELDHHDERGSATVLGVGIIAVMVVLIVAALSIGGAVVASHRARSAADLAALAGAGDVRLGRAAEAACARVETMVRAAGADVDHCAVIGMEVTVAVSVPVPGLGALAGRRAEATARAGPSRSTGEVRVTGAAVRAGPGRSAAEIRPPG